MTRLPRFIIAVALIGITSIALANGASTTNSNASPLASGLASIEVDVIFPIQNTTYNDTTSLPIVFALQISAAAVALGPFRFIWDIMPYGKIGSDPVPGGVVNDQWISKDFTTANTLDEPYILVNQTNVKKWQWGPEFPYGSYYALQWSIWWDNTTKLCALDPVDLSGVIFFEINNGAPEPDLDVLVGKCSQLGRAYEINTAPQNSNCSAVRSGDGTGDPCAVTIDKPKVASISSAVQSLITASAAAASASSASAAARASALVYHPPNTAVSSKAPLQYVAAAIFLLGSLQMVILP
jgi:hypothetical protein